MSILNFFKRNSPGRQFIDKIFTLETPIVNGAGKILIGDTIWTLAGVDTPPGITVRVVGVDGDTLRVEPSISA